MLTKFSTSFLKKLTLIVFLFVYFFVIRTSDASTTSTLLPVSDGSYAQFTPSTGTSHYALVDESSCNGNTDYNSETTTTQRDSYNLSLSSIPNGSTITQISITPCASKNATGGSNSTFNVFYRLDGVNSADAGSYSLSTTTPADLAATNFSGLSISKTSTTALQIGGVHTSGTKGVRLSRIAAVITYTTPVPTVVTSGTSSITSSSATLSGYVTPNGSSTDRIFRYGTSNVGCSSLPNTTTPVNVGSGTSQVYGTQVVSGLSASTTYYYCVSATNEGGTSYGSVFSFTTNPAATAPSITSEAANNITSNSASVSALINPNYGTTTRIFRYDTVNTSCSALSNTTTSANLGSGGTYVNTSSLLNSLIANTTYYYCAEATNEAGTTYGTVNSFTTLP